MAICAGCVKSVNHACTHPPTDLTLVQMDAASTAVRMTAEAFLHVSGIMMDESTRQRWATRLTELLAVAPPAAAQPQPFASPAVLQHLVLWPNVNHAVTVYALIRLVEPTCWINDHVVFELATLYNAALGARHGVYCVDTTLVTYVTQGEHRSRDIQGQLMRMLPFEGRGVNKVLVPWNSNHGSHWSLLAFERNNDDPHDMEPWRCTLYDSMADASSARVKSTRKLVQAIAVHLEVAFKGVAWNNMKVPLRLDKDFEQQHDGVSCGAFMATAMHTLAEGGVPRKLPVPVRDMRQWLATEFATRSVQLMYPLLRDDETYCARCSALDPRFVYAGGVFCSRECEAARHRL